MTRERTLRGNGSEILTPDTPKYTSTRTRYVAMMLSRRMKENERIKEKKNRGKKRKDTCKASKDARDK